MGRIERTCEYCNRVFEIAEWALRHKKQRSGRFCSRACKIAAQRGQPQPWAKPLTERTPTRRKDGYLLVPVEEGSRRRQLGHRLVVEQALGRPLSPEEHVHHINGDKADNRLENLLVLTPGEHHALHVEIGTHVQSLPRRLSFTCQRCGVTYERKRSRQSETKYCSASCRIAAMHQARRDNAARRRLEKG